MREPVVIVHGYLAPKWFMLPLRERLRKGGYDAHLVDLTPLALSDVRVLARQLAGNVDRIRAQTGAEKVTLLGVSLGGFVALQYVQDGGAPYTHRIIAMGAPFQGTWFGLLGVPLFGAWSPPIWQTLPTSGWLKQLREAGCPVPLTTVSIPGDIVAPPDRCRFDGADNILLEPTKFPAAHQWLGLSAQIARRICDLLAEDEPEAARAYGT